MTQPDGFGRVAFNDLPADQAESLLRGICSSRRWVSMLLAGRPYPTVDDVLRAADAALAALSAEDIEEALAGHPRIGERAGAGHSSWSNREQAGVTGVDDETMAALAVRNRAYEQRFGHVYLVCATGRAAGELLAILDERLDNDAAAEQAVVRRELGKINRIRLERLLSEGE